MHSVTSGAVYSALDGKTIKHKTVSGTTNSWGVLYKNNSGGTILGTERFINCYLKNGTDDYVCLVGSSPVNGQWIQVRNYQMTIMSNTYVEIDVIYF